MAPRSIRQNAETEMRKLSIGWTTGSGHPPPQSTVETLDEIVSVGVVIIIIIIIVFN